MSGEPMLVDGSAFRGRDASFDWAREWFGIVVGYAFGLPDGSVYEENLITGTSRPFGPRPLLSTAEGRLSQESSGTAPNQSNSISVTAALFVSLYDLVNTHLARRLPWIIAIVATGMLGEVDSPPTDVYNCLAWALGFQLRWIQPGRSGMSGPLFFIESKTIVATIDGRFTPATSPSAFAIEYQGGWIPFGMRRIRVFEDSAQPLNWHVMRQDEDGTWSSKNGGSFRFARIKDPNLFYLIHYRPKGMVVVTDYIVAFRLIRLKEGK